MLSVEDILKVAKVSQYLSFVNNSKSVIFGQRLSPINSHVLYVERKTLEYMLNSNPNSVEVQAVADYVLSLCGGYAAQALDIINGVTGGGVVTVTTPNGFQYVSLSFVVSDAPNGTDSPINGTTVWVNPIFIGAEQLTTMIVNNAVESLAYGDFTFDKTLGKITRTNGNVFTTGDIIILSFLKKI